MYILWFILGFLVIFFTIFSLMLIKHYVDPAENYGLSTIVISLSLTVSFMCLMIIPIDVFVNSNQGLKNQSIFDVSMNKNDIKTYSFYLYSLLLFSTFFLIPFTYFYGEERSEYLDFEYEEAEACNNIYKALKYTFIFILFTAILLSVGLVMRPGYNKGIEQGKEVQWIKQIFDVEHVGQSAISFCIAVLTCIGTLFWVTYGAQGLASLPIELIKGNQSLQDAKDDLSNDLADIREKYRSIQEKYARSHIKITRNDQRILQNLKKQERLLSNKTEKIEFIENNFGTLRRIFTILTPFRVMIGFICLGFSGTIFGSLLLTTLDKVLNSKCGWKCGYLIEKSSFRNPIDFFLVYSAKYFPLDHILFFFLMFYIFVSLLYAITTQGIHLFCIQVFEIKKQKTLPQALLIMAFIMSFSVLVVSSQTLILSPQYVTFGHQTFKKDHQWVPCALSAISKNDSKTCQMSIVSQFLNKISVSIPIFAIVFFCANIIFLTLNLIFFLYSIYKKKSSQFDDDYDSDTNVFEVEETNQLML